MRKISKRATLQNSKIDCKEVTIEDGVKLENVHIKAKSLVIRKNSILVSCKLFSEGPISIGKDCTIKENTVVNAFRGITIGDRTIIDRDVMIGGMQSQHSEIDVGNDCVILFRSYLNTTRKITIGNKVGVGGYCLIFTHSSWPNVLEGAPFKFKEVMIKDKVWLPWNVTVFPGVIIGKNTILGGGSVVTGDIPENVFAAGVPAKIIKKNTNITKSKKNQILIEIIRDYHEYASEFLGMKNSIIEDKKGIRMKFDKAGIVFSKNFLETERNYIALGFVIPGSIKSKFEWIELDSLTSNVKSNTGKDFLSFIKRYGIRIS